MKRYYSETIPTELGIKLQDAGMKVEWQDNTPIDYPLVPDWGCLTTYAEVIDWLTSRGIIAYVIPQPSKHKLGEIISVWTGYCEGAFVQASIGWRCAAVETIECALKMLKEGKK